MLSPATMSETAISSVVLIVRQYQSVVVDNSTLLGQPLFLSSPALHPLTNLVAPFFTAIADASNSEDRAIAVLNWFIVSSPFHGTVMERSRIH
ncbi:uncharacterized protein LACBIDRAFT_300260 [Laccaria bicolor S238N-H82]|uniref:Predicted protein n=1 Tax=Laccaria bicolor (strain S238N-H82 / ATCC MYA-4686) TaxID=486041 RepID=B0DGC2_LACBS|nr:uncharacterized protein LACBIDRAFT_300260 [Laccaria bicolor S238N-H82]EDR06124.1 predicted protein [Laccaria bicolor S238N-H82]|eukprot:XP_001882985.1 predicted protein [Laccaria bicolor S238N-H82]